MVILDVIVYVLMHVCVLVVAVVDLYQRVVDTVLVDVVATHVI